MGLALLYTSNKLVGLVEWQVKLIMVIGVSHHEVNTSKSWNKC